MASAPQTPTSLHQDPATKPVTVTATTTAAPKGSKKPTDAAPIAHQEALTTSTPRAPAAAAARNNHESRLPTRHVLHRTFDSSFPGCNWVAIRHRRTHLATRRQRKTWSPTNAAAFPVFAYDPVRPRQQLSSTLRRRLSSPANWPANVILTAQLVGVLEHVKAACAERGDKKGKRWWDALCAARWPLNFTSTGKARAVQPVAPVGWPREGVREGDKVVDTEEGGRMAVVGGGCDGEGEGKGSRVEVVESEAEGSTMHLGDALRERVDEISVTADEGGGGGARETTGTSGKRPAAEDWRIDDTAHKRFLSDMQGSIMRLKRSYDEAKTESVQIPPHVRDKELRRLADLEAEKSKDAAHIQELEAEVEKEKARNQSHATKLEALMQAVRGLEAQSSDASEKLDNLNVLFYSAFKHMIYLRYQLNGANAQLEGANKTDAQKTTMLKDQQIEIEELEKRGKDLLLQTEQYQENIECLSRSGGTSNTKITELQTSLEEWQSRAQELQTQNENDRKILETLEQEASTQQSKIGVLEETLKDHQSRAQMVQSENERESAKLQESQTQVMELTAKLEVAAKREKRLEESLGFVAHTMLDMIGGGQKDANTVGNAPGGPANGADVIAEQDGLKTLLEQLLAGQNGE
ncbi:Autophagy-like protein 11 [Lasiodiplodia theobromae]|uniref:Autophagy-like protein 11 n=1 Tax=Lasiodiplodia theobromae TaxID=45133 RepID=UPI0015C36DCD|nr:Autophagy-like protein 11 [Lasiodiplodia theobromae]KAF4534581.1 Autophagy-like protein 11 [Lasiodiplodia theobromae]